MSQEIIELVSKDQLKADRHVFKVGDMVAVHTIVREGDKERIQLFSGIVIARHGSGISETFTVRRVSAGEGVERIFNVNSPFIAKIEVEHESVPMRAKLYYMRNRIGKSAMQIKEKRLADAKK
ncbi:MAG: 50S ribosomal protein L19 [Puniceicoccales bacterium]|jgi:large subunit ribosomal protein L19|nr:50S ribosomal protein L19 [Puniceicoccales bacterium]